MIETTSALNSVVIIRIVPFDLTLSFCFCLPKQCFDLVETLTERQAKLETSLGKYSLEILEVFRIGQSWLSIIGRVFTFAVAWRQSPARQES